jgi:signal transduction histidine kinase
MSNRFLSAVQPQRRHLAFLVGLLVLTFALTVVLTVRAHRAEVARQAQAHGILQDLVDGAAREWGGTIRGHMPDAVRATFYRAWALLLTDADAPLDGIADRADPANLCAGCSHPAAATSFLSLDLLTGAEEYLGDAERLSPELRSTIEESVARGTFAAYHDLLGIALYAAANDQGVQAAVATVRLDGSGRPIRVIAYFVPEATLAQLVTLVFNNLNVLPSSLARGLPNDALFSARALVGSTPLLDSGRSSDMIAATFSDTEPLIGLTLEVGLSESAARALLLPGGLSSGVPVLLGLLLAIGVLIVLALILVRREAELVRLRADFISGVSHELRTPLAQIRMFTETLLLGRVRSDVERRRSLEIVDQEARRLSHLVENLLHFSKSEGGRPPLLKPVPAAFADEIRLAAESFAPMCRKARTEIRTELQENVVVPVDRGALRQIMLNLIDNALKYGPEGQRVTVGAALFDDIARVWVDDEGPGIPEDQRERVFDSFYRMPREIESSSSTGSGIGLAVVRELARLHGGIARAEAAPGGGARVVVDFPDAYLRAGASADLAAAS